MAGEAITNTELMRLRQACQNLELSEKWTLQCYAHTVDEQIADDLVYSLLAGQSYEAISQVRYIPVSKRGFYREQEKLLKMMREWFIHTGRWE